MLKTWLTGRVAVAVVTALITLVLGVPGVREAIPDPVEACLDQVDAVEPLPRAARPSVSSLSSRTRALLLDRLSQ